MTACPEFEQNQNLSGESYGKERILSHQRKINNSDIKGGSHYNTCCLQGPWCWKVSTATCILNSSSHVCIGGAFHVCSVWIFFVLTALYLKTQTKAVLLFVALPACLTEQGSNCLQAVNQKKHLPAYCELCIFASAHG